jgi:hypothetical protein
MIRAASVTFSTNPVTDISDVSFSGTLAGSGNVGANPPGASFTGVQFDAGTAVFGSSVSGYQDFTSLDSPGLNFMLDSLTYATSPRTLTFSGLSSGTDYEAQFFITQDVSSRNVSVSDGMGGSITTAPVSSPQMVTGTFTAESPSQDFLFNASDGVPILNGYQLRDLSAPDSSPAPMPLNYDVSSVTDPAGVLTAGDLISAHNVNGPDLTVAGVTFAATGAIADHAIFDLPLYDTNDDYIASYLSAFQVRGLGPIPEPSAAALLAIVGLLIIHRRR